MDFNDFRLRFSEPDRKITLDQFRALNVDELNALIRDANLSRPNADQARLFHPSSLPKRSAHVNLSPVRIFGNGNQPTSTALIIGRRTVLTCEHSLKVSKQLNGDAMAVNESYEMNYWIQEKTKLGSRGGYSPDGRINVRLYKCNQDNDWALLYRVSGYFKDDEIVSIDTTASGMTEDEFFNAIRATNGSFVHCPVRHIQNTTFANEFTLVAFQSDITVQSASFRHILYSGHEMINGSSGGGVIVSNKLVALNQDRIHDCVEDEIIAPATKKLKSDSETVASRPVSSAAVNCAMILCRCRKLMAYFEKIEMRKC